MFIMTSSLLVIVVLFYLVFGSGNVTHFLYFSFPYNFLLISKDMHFDILTLEKGIFY